MPTIVDLKAPEIAGTAEMKKSSRKTSSNSCNSSTSTSFTIHVDEDVPEFVKMNKSNVLILKDLPFSSESATRTTKIASTTSRMRFASSQKQDKKQQRPMAGKRQDLEDNKENWDPDRCVFFVNSNHSSEDKQHKVPPISAVAKSTRPSISKPISKDPLSSPKRIREEENAERLKLVHSGLLTPRYDDYAYELADVTEAYSPDLRTGGYGGARLKSPAILGLITESNSAMEQRTKRRGSITHNEDLDVPPSPTTNLAATLALDSEIYEIFGISEKAVDANVSEKVVFETKSRVKQTKDVKNTKLVKSKSKSTGVVLGAKSTNATQPQKISANILKKEEKSSRLSASAENAKPLTCRDDHVVVL